MQQYAGEEQDRRHKRNRPVLQPAPLLEFNREVIDCQYPGDQGKYQEPGWVHSDWDTVNSKQVDRVVFHPCALRTGIYSVITLAAWRWASRMSPIPPTMPTFTCPVRLK